jgi:hypothetical protein
LKILMTFPWTFLLNEDFLNENCSRINFLEVVE